MAQTTLQRGIIGHRHAVAFLERVLASGRPSHAYLLHGQARVGKTTLATALAQALNCEAEVRPCGLCRPCRRISEGHHPDVRIVGVHGSDDAAPDSRRSRRPARLISLEQIKSVEHDATLAPYEGRWKVYIVAGAELLSVEAMNSLLKTLEEPPPQVVLVLTTTDPTLLLPTIVSRCQQIRLGTIAIPELAQGLRDRFGVDAARAELLANLSGGRAGWAVAAIHDASILEQRSEHLADLVNFGHSQLVDRFAYAEKLSQDFSRDPERVRAILHLWMGWWRDLLLVRGQCLDQVSNRDRLDELQRQAERFTLEQVHSFLRAIQRALDQLAQNVNPRLTFEVLLLDLPTG